MSEHDPFDLQRFIKAQESSYGRALSELRAGQKRSHWMWYIFPQIQGLGSSLMAIQYAIQDLQEAKAYLEHPILGERLLQCTQAVLDINGRSVLDIFGFPDDLKFRSSMTLFKLAAGKGSIFELALNKFFAGQEDVNTISNSKFNG